MQFAGHTDRAQGSFHFLSQGKQGIHSFEDTIFVNKSCACNEQGVHRRNRDEQQVVIAAAENMIRGQFFLMIIFCDLEPCGMDCHQRGNQRDFHAFIVQFTGAGLHKTAIIQQEDRLGVYILPEIRQKIRHSGMPLFGFFIGGSFGWEDGLHEAKAAFDYIQKIRKRNRFIEDRQCPGV